MEILDRWYDPNYNGFKVLVDDGRTYRLRHNMNADAWELNGASPLGNKL